MSRVSRTVRSEAQTFGLAGVKFKRATPNSWRRELPLLGHSWDALGERCPDFVSKFSNNMPLVSYSDSEDSQASNHSRTQEAPQSSQTTKRKRSLSSPSDLPPLPSNFHDLYATTSRISNQDDPTLHDGRQRQVPHVEGNWPTHVYIECRPSLPQ